MSELKENTTCTVAYVEVTIIGPEGSNKYNYVEIVQYETEPFYSSRCDTFGQLTVAKGFKSVSSNERLNGFYGDSAEVVMSKLNNRANDLNGVRPYSGYVREVPAYKGNDPETITT